MWAMSEPTQPPPYNPYGQQPQGQPAYGQPAAFGQQPYGQPAYGQFGGPGRDPDKRPATVTWAGVVTLVFSGLSILLFAFVLVAMVVARDDMVTEIDKELSGTAGLEDFTADDIANLAIVAMVVFLVWCLSAIVLAVLAMRRAGWARIMLVVSAAMTALFSLVGIGSLISGVTLIAGIAVVVLLFTGGANDWYARRSAQPQLPPGTTQPWG